MRVCQSVCDQRNKNEGIGRISPRLCEVGQDIDRYTKKKPHRSPQFLILPAFYLWLPNSRLLTNYFLFFSSFCHVPSEDFKAIYVNDQRNIASICSCLFACCSIDIYLSIRNIRKRSGRRWVDRTTKAFNKSEQKWRHMCVCVVVCERV